MTNAQKEIFNKFGHFSVCVDSTHGINKSYFQLTIIMVVDAYGTGVSVALAISNKIDTLTIDFFVCVSRKSGIVKTRGLITDVVGHLLCGHQITTIYTCSMLRGLLEASFLKLPSKQKSSWFIKLSKRLLNIITEKHFHSY